MVSDRSRRIQSMNERIFLLFVSLFFLALALFTLAIIGDTVFHLGWGFKVSDFKTVGIIGVIGAGIFVWSRIVKRILDRV